MNFKKNFKRFFTLSRNAEGFTLVELIVVIAILGILAVVAVPAYSGYVERSERAVDNSQIGVLNSAFAIACVYNGVDPAYFTSGVTLTWEGQTVKGVDVPEITRTASETSTASLIEADFAATIGTGVEFKVYTSSDITFSNGKFVGPDGETGGEGNNDANRPTLPVGEKTTLKYQGKDIVVDNEDINNLKYSTFIEKIGAEDLMEQVDDVTGIAADMADSDIMGAILESDGFKQAAMAALGVTTQAELDDAFEELAVGYMLTYDCDLGEAAAQVKANAAVLYAAQQTSGMTVQNVKDLLIKTETNNPYDVISGNLVSADGSGTGLSQAALAYGMYTAFANSGATGSEKITDTSPDAVLDDLGNADFQAYLASPQGEADMQAYLSAMNVVNSNTQQTEVVKDLMVNGYANEDLIGAITEAMGKIQ